MRASMKFKKFNLARLLLAFSALSSSHCALADVPLVSGIYRIEPAIENIEPPLPPEISDRGTYVHRNGPAVRADASYAMLARSADEGNSKFGWQLLLIPSRAPSPQDPDSRCAGYLFNDYGSDNGLCSSHSLSMQPSNDGTSFVISSPDSKAELPAIYIKRETPLPPEKIGVALALGIDPWGWYVSSFEITHLQSRFTLQTPLAVERILKLARPTSIYAERAVAFPEQVLDANSYVGVLHTDSEWLEVVQAKRDGRLIRGWLDRDRIEELQWIDQEATIDNFRFRVAYTTSPPDSFSEQNAVAVEVLESSTGKRHQVLRDFYSRPREPSSRALEIVDANFDGKLDFSIDGDDGGAGPNYTTNFFLFNPKTRYFEYNEELSNLSQISINAKSRTISSGVRGGCCYHSDSKWRYIQGNLTEIMRFEQEYMSEQNWVKESTCRYSEGKLRCKSKKVRP